ncbi:M23 family metallopeptidase [Citrobacter sp. MNAZ 1397]|jgi:murein DD-endopeptidase MepM/ murein hydrolase activator NlpD|uniref:M23 family metallopeptidase n=1 Tax=Citrobacter sp. MNAZ 1397 TaxID=2911205 RepID=UPI0020267B88|nr:M23 family metallopeptidase [Citrobacter sp. MNAZ 1397]MCL9670315.1 M23 family metallopeptidase [Citrobacter sp. MNAZ 1397]DAU22114.1 MAG TPA: peptidase [Caudoviricetes sp.]
MVYLLVLQLPRHPVPVNSNGAVAETSEVFCFPFPKIPEKSWSNGGHQFGAPRKAKDGSARKHAGCDLIFPVGTPIYAVADGVLVQNPYSFYSSTYAVEIRHGNLLLRCGEIAPGSCSYSGGSSVKKGQIIAKVGRLRGGSSMLHLEIYTNGASSTALTTTTGDYRWRSDVTDPTQYLNVWKNNRPRS